IPTSTSINLDPAPPTLFTYTTLFRSRLATKSNQIKQLIRNGRSASLQRTFKKSFTSFSHSTRNKTRDGLIRVRNIRALNVRCRQIGRAVQQECRDRSRMPSSD